MNENKQTRREFGGFLGKLTVATWGTGILVPLFSSCDHGKNPAGNENNDSSDADLGTAILLSEHPELQQIGAFIVLTINSKEVIVIREDENTFKALSAICTHQGCTISLNQSDQLICPCHGSKFSTTGDVIQGPATQPLASYTVTYNADAQTLYVKI